MTNKEIQKISNKDEKDKCLSAFKELVEVINEMRA
jgi:hypothetical protein